MHFVGDLWLKRECAVLAAFLVIYSRQRALRSVFISWMFRHTDTHPVWLMVWLDGSHLAHSLRLPPTTLSVSLCTFSLFGGSCLRFWNGNGSVYIWLTFRFLWVPVVSRVPGRWRSFDPVFSLIYFGRWIDPSLPLHRISRSNRRWGSQSRRERESDDEDRSSLRCRDGRVWVLRLDFVGGSSR